jgi:HK97 family phage major capsid protein
MQLQNTAGFLIFASGVAGGPDTLLGRPYKVTEMLPSLGKFGDIMLIDPTFYVIGDRQATTIEATQFDKWAEFKTSWRVMHRVDGQPWLDAPITFSDGSFQVSPFIALNDQES